MSWLKPEGKAVVSGKEGAFVFCGACMVEMRCLHESSFECPICGIGYEAWKAV